MVPENMDAYCTRNLHVGASDIRFFAKRVINTCMSNDYLKTADFGFLLVLRNPLSL